MDYLLSFVVKPISRFGFSSSLMSWRMASNTALNCSSYLGSKMALLTHGGHFIITQLLGLERNPLKK